ncbi:basic leucine zipper 2-like isoform X1 [Chenopodium quinoa]|uniref:basic leucine zipper 2-like isoform X1 n=1 Tax=Chenopodium quinoa TaxID=63459 RepID=UPI000B783D6A|nr:basic leucine zipper 2-like isoform X1 [Chenopodium quinoa]XP_021773468.1 basic leucine zipper 2-like isoform X1 [Chenopodium quinoa]
MSRPSQLPPRCPLQKKAVACQTHDPSLIYSQGVDKSSARHHRSLSQSSVLEDQPAWLDDLLNSDSVPKGIRHCRSASDSFAVLDGIVPNLLLSASHEEEQVEDGNILGSGCIYGPNSPRRRSTVEFLDNTVLLAMSDYVDQSSMQFVKENPQIYGTHLDLKNEFCDAPSYYNIDAKTEKRHPGQRSRTRKLQYIAELERTVNVFQTLQSELSIRVSTLLQQKVGLSLENNKLKQQVAKLQQQKLSMDGEYQTLSKEAQRLKLSLANSRSSTIDTYVGSNETDSGEVSWQILDWTKLHL